MASSSSASRGGNDHPDPTMATSAPPGPSPTMLNMATKEKYIENYDFMYCDESSKYEKVAKIGQGTFG